MRRKVKPKELSRRGFIKVAAIGGGALLVGITARQLHNQIGRNFQPDRAKAYLDSIQLSSDLEVLPNIIVILCDDLGKGDLSSPVIDTSNLKRMAMEGTTLTNFYASASVCSPSRAGFLTGRYPVRTLISTPLLSTHNPLNVVMDVLGRYSYNVRGIPADEVLLSEALQRRGYHTGLMGKWHLGGTDGYLPNDRGFDAFYGALWSNDDLPYAIYRNRQVEIPAPANQDNLTHNFTQEAIKFIQFSQGQPFFLYLAHAMPHYPVHASLAFQNKSGAGRYGDAVEEIDWSVGEILTNVAQLGLDKKTLVIFTCDHGPWMQGNPGIARGRKLQWFEGGFRVPLIARWPGVILSGIANPGMSVNFDLFSTCLKLAGLPLPEDRIIDGKDILPLLKGEAPSPHDAFYYYDTRTAVAVRYQQWKYCRRYLTDIATYWPTKQGPFLFNLENDHTESYSMIEAEPAMAARLSAMLDEFEAGMESNLRGWL
jgi:arylsulfatase A